MALKWYTKLNVARKRCPIVFQCHQWNLKVTWDKKSPILTPELSISGQKLQFEFTEGFEMMLKAWCNVEGVPYNFSRSSIKFQGHTGWKIDDFNPIWVRLLGRSQLSNPSDLPCCDIFFNLIICVNMSMNLGETYRWKGRDIVMMRLPVPLLWCYDYDSTLCHYGVTWFEYVLCRHTMHECVMNIH